jgi:branched-chain amino acid transport system substrate-binding protein
MHRLARIRSRRSIRNVIAAGLAAGSMAAAVAVLPSAAAVHHTVAKASGSTWVIGNIGTYSGENSANFYDGGLALQAWVDYTNANGGVNGHKIKLITMDDAGSPSTAVNDVKQLVQQDKVLAIVAMNSGVEADFGAYTTAQDVPVIGGSTPVPDFFIRPNFFPVGATANNSVVNLLSYAKNVLHQTKGGYLYCIEAPVCAQLEPVYAGAYKAIGGTLAYTSSFSSTAASYTSECLAAQSKGVQDLEIIGPSPILVKIAQTCNSLGYHPTLLSNDVTLTPALAKQLGSATSIWGADAFPFTESAGRAVTFQQALAKYEPSVLSTSTFTQDDADSWASGELFAAAAKAGGLGDNPTRAQLIAGLYKLKGDTLGGLTPPLTFKKNKPNSVNCIFMIKVANGTISEPQGLRPYCAA